MTLFLLLIAGQIDFTAAASSRVVIPGGATHIVHVRDWHLVTKDHFSADTELTGDALSAAYERHIATVKAVQASQRKILGGVTDVFIEGLKDSDGPAFAAMIAQQRKSPEPAELLRLGSAAQLMIAGSLAILPAEGEAFEEANPLASGAFAVDEARAEAREDAIVRKLLAKGGRVVLVLGGAHDLSDNVRRLSKDCGLTEITPKGWPE